MEFVEVDGSSGEGGGQILRSAVAFSSALGTPVRVSKVRAGRDVPGLKRQHASALRVLGEVFDCKLEGAVEGSAEVAFVPGPVKSRSVVVDMGTAASVPLVLQAVVPAAALAGSPLRLQLTGGTDVPWSPTFDYFVTVVREALGAMGLRFEASARRRGYYPKGGGVVEVWVQPSAGISPLNLAAPRKVSKASARSRCGMLPMHVAERQLQGAAGALEGSGVGFEGASTLEESSSPGSSICIEGLGSGSFVGADAIGSRGRRAEDVGGDAGTRFLEAVRSGARMDSNVADMTVPLLSMASGPSVVRIEKLTSHLESGFELARLFTGAKFDVVPEGTSSLVTVSPGRRPDSKSQHNV